VSQSLVTETCGTRFSFGIPRIGRSDSSGHKYASGNVLPTERNAAAEKRPQDDQPLGNSLIAGPFGGRGSGFAIAELSSDIQ
jgi:hypothetical protein